MAQQNNLKTDNIHQIDPYCGPRWLVEERDACGVGFIADVRGSGSHQLIEQALLALGCLEHRGGCSADQDSGDGSGMMTAIPRDVLAPWFAENGLNMPESEKFEFNGNFFGMILGLCNSTLRIWDLLVLLVSL